ncbi:TolC family protein [Sediminitomix flava]|uniref:Outer membrane efflux protein n=1 Tax=Sediminitomix flava TaxID=379075 RepID=A0A315Z5T8_SEDFL|nr:TolC family protein [Sediminitomix flava]PWJ38506.1 outer membrane efflux protein [Sediminitomix flava]
MKQILLSLLLFYSLTSSAQEYSLDKIADRTLLDSLVVRAMGQSNEIKNLLILREQKQEKLKIQRKSWMESFSVGLQFFNFDNTNADLGPQLGILSNVSGGLSLSIYSIFTRKNRVAIAEKDILVTENAIRDSEISVRKDIEDKYLAYLQVLEVLKYRQEALDRLEEQEILLKLKFTKGEATYQDVISVTSAINQTQEALIAAKIEKSRIYRDIKYMTEEMPSIRLEQDQLFEEEGDYEESDEDEW